MTESWQNDADMEQAIVKVEVSPQPDSQGTVSDKERGLFGRFCIWLFPKLENCADMAEAYGNAEVAQNESEAKRTAEEAAEIAARREVELANAETQRQIVSREFTENVKAIESLDSPFGKALAFAKLLEQNPALQKQLETVEQLVSELNLKHGMTLSQLPKEEIAKVQPSDSVAE